MDKFEQDRNSAVGAGGSVDDYEISYTYAKSPTPGSGQGRSLVRRTSATMFYNTALTYGYGATDSIDAAVRQLVRGIVAPILPCDSCWGVASRTSPV